MKFIKINDDVMINLEEISYICYRYRLGELILGLKNREKDFICHSNCDEVFAKIQNAIAECGSIIK